MYAGLKDVLLMIRFDYGGLGSHLSRIQEAGMLKGEERWVSKQSVTLYSKAGRSISK